MTSARVTAIAEKLATSRYRFLTDVQIGVLRRQHSATRDEIRTAAILADRIRRQRQAREVHAGFTVTGTIDPGAPIVLPQESRSRGRRIAA